MRGKFLPISGTYLLSFRQTVLQGRLQVLNDRETELYGKRLAPIGMRSVYFGEFHRARWRMCLTAMGGSAEHFKSRRTSTRGVDVNCSVSLSLVPKPRKSDQAAIREIYSRLS